MAQKATPTSGKQRAQMIPMDNYGVFADRSATARASSVQVARMFGKDHKNVLRDIAALDCSEEFSRLNFEPSTYKDERGKRQPCINMTRDGFMFLVMGYRGKKAGAIKEAYINRFNAMESLIVTLLEAREDCPELTENIRALYDNPSGFRFSNEFDMLNRLATGRTAKQIRTEHGLPDRTSIRPYLTPEQLELLCLLQKTDIGLTLAIPEFERRKQILTATKQRWEAKRTAAALKGA